jgi:Fe-Mn family superoxide dismutase
MRLAGIRPRVRFCSNRRNSMRYEIAPLFCRPWTLNGISPRLIESHYEHNYGSAVNRLNALAKELEALDAATPAHVVARLKREEAAALNSRLLHELYFASLGGDGRVVPDTMARAIERDFGSVDRWRREFIALANSLAGGSGWVLLSYVPRDARLIILHMTIAKRSLAPFRFLRSTCTSTPIISSLARMRRLI